MVTSPYEWKFLERDEEHQRTQTFTPEESELDLSQDFDPSLSKTSQVLLHQPSLIEMWIFKLSILYLSILYIILGECIALHLTNLKFL